MPRGPRACLLVWVYGVVLCVHLRFEPPLYAQVPENLLGGECR